MATAGETGYTLKIEVDGVEVANLRVPPGLQDDEISTLVAVQKALPYVEMPADAAARLRETTLEAVRQHLKPGTTPATPTTP